MILVTKHYCVIVLLLHYDYAPHGTTNDAVIGLKLSFINVSYFTRFILSATVNVSLGSVINKDVFPHGRQSVHGHTTSTKHRYYIRLSAKPGVHHMRSTASTVAFS